MSDFDDLIARIEQLTGLTGRDAAQVAFSFDADYVPKPQEIVEAAANLGFDVERKHAPAKTAAPIGVGITMDPATVMEQVYWLCPRLIPADESGQVNMPAVGKAPDEARKLDEVAELIEELPEEIALALVKIDLFGGSATFWIRDGANNIDRPIGPIDLTRYNDGRELNEAIEALCKRVDRVLVADWN